MTNAGKFKQKERPIVSALHRLLAKVFDRLALSQQEHAYAGQ